jgi:predicted nucleotidyltransferase
VTRHLFRDEAALVSVRQRHHILRLSLFGSMLKGSAGPHSDVDLLVQFAPGRGPGLLRLAAIEAGLSELSGGRKADLRTPRDLSHHFRDEVVRSAEVQHAA